MYRIARIYNIEVGHRLAKHKGKCKNIHGHNYKVEVGVKSNTLNENDMVMDFAYLKDVVNKILDHFDHALVLNFTEDKELVHFLHDHEMKVFPFRPGEPTAELMSEWLYRELVMELAKTEIGTVVEVDFVKIWETDNSYAEFRLE